MAINKIKDCSGMSEESHEELNKLADMLKAAPEDHGIRYSLIQEYLKLGIFDEAEEVIKQGIMISNQHAPFYYCLGSMHYLKDENESAIRSLQVATSLDHDYRDPRFLLACLYKLQNDFNNARNILNELQPLVPDMIQVHEMLGDIYVEIGMLEMAKGEYEAVLKAEPDNNEVRFKADVMGML